MSVVTKNMKLSALLFECNKELRTEYHSMCLQLCYHYLRKDCWALVADKTQELSDMFYVLYFNVGLYCGQHQPKLSCLRNVSRFNMLPFAASVQINQTLQKSLYANALCQCGQKCNQAAMRTNHVLYRIPQHMIIAYQRNQTIPTRIICDRLYTLNVISKQYMCRFRTMCHKVAWILRAHAKDDVSTNNLICSLPASIRNTVLRQVVVSATKKVAIYELRFVAWSNAKGYLPKHAKVHCEAHKAEKLVVEKTIDRNYPTAVYELIQTKDVIRFFRV